MRNPMGIDLDDIIMLVELVRSNSNLLDHDLQSERNISIPNGSLIALGS